MHSTDAEFNEWTDDELAAERDRLVRKYPHVHSPYINDEDEDMTRLLKVQMAIYLRHRRLHPEDFIFTPYLPLHVFRATDITIDDLKRKTP